MPNVEGREGKGNSQGKEKRKRRESVSSNLSFIIAGGKKERGRGFGEGSLPRSKEERLRPTLTHLKRRREKKARRGGRRKEGG